MLAKEFEIFILEFLRTFLPAETAVEVGTPSTHQNDALREDSLRVVASALGEEFFNEFVASVLVLGGGEVIQPFVFPFTR